MNRRAFKHEVMESGCGLADIQVLAVGASGNPFTIYHYHNCYEVVIIRQGFIEGVVHSVLGRLTRGSVVLIGRNLPHGVIGFSDDLQGVLIHIPHTVLSWCMEFVPELHQEVRFMQESRYGYRFSSDELAGQLVSLAGEIADSEGFQRVSCLFRLLHVLSRAAPPERLVADTGGDSDAAPAGACETAVDRAFRFVYLHFQEDITLDDIAEYAHQNATALCRAFKRRSGCSLFGFINRLRIEKACQLLRDTDSSVAQIAFQVGFNTFSHFSSQFRALVKTSPSRYRRRIGR